MTKLNINNLTLRVLIGCEFSGIVREAFASRGWYAVSCDFLPTELPCDYFNSWHMQCDVRRLLKNDGEILLEGTGNLPGAPEVNPMVLNSWDLAIVHPSCQYLAASGLHWNLKRPDRAAKTEEALKFIRDIVDAPIERIAIENPIGCISTRIRKPDQIIQPWQHGDPFTKATCLWLKNLPKLVPSNIVEGREPKCWKEPPGKDRWKNRSRTYPGIAQALAEQYTIHFNSLKPV